MAADGDGGEGKDSPRGWKLAVESEREKERHRSEGEGVGEPRPRGTDEDDGVEPPHRDREDVKRPTDRASDEPAQGDRPDERD